MTTLYTLDGWRITYDDRVGDGSNGELEDPAVDFAPSTLTFQFASDVTEVSYTTGEFVGPGGRNPDDPNIFITLSPTPNRTALDGESVAIIHDPLGSLFEFTEVNQESGASYLFLYSFDDSFTDAFFDNTFRYEYYFPAAGAAVPEFTTNEQFVAWADTLTSMSNPPTNAFTAGETIPLSAFDWDAVLTISDPVARTGSEVGETLLGGTAGDTFDALAGDDSIFADGGDDLIIAGAGSDTVDGGEGTDRAVFSGPQTSYTLTLSVNATTIADRRPDGDGTDTLRNVELLDFAAELPIFGDEPMNLDAFDGPTGLTAEEFAAITELYIAYFNRAPDAIGLYFWGSAFANGLSLAAMAEQFFDQVETRATYADVLDDTGTLVTDTAAFVTEVYANVLGRAFDAAGRDFWVGVLDRGEVTPASFISAIIDGAKAPAEPGSSADFVAQKQADVAYLGTKTDIGAYFAVINGMSDVANANAVMALYDGSQSSTDAAVAEIQALAAMAQDADTGEFLMPLVGVIDDPFA